MVVEKGLGSRGGPTARIPQQHLETLFNAFIHPTRVWITYTSDRNPEPRTRLVEPHGVMTGTRYHLVAREFVFHPGQVMTDLEDGSLLVEFTASGSVETAWHLVIWETQSRSWHRLS